MYDACAAAHINTVERGLLSVGCHTVVHSVSFEEFISLLPRCDNGHKGLMPVASCLISKRRERSTRSLLPKEKGS